ncbi:MAG TPA: nitroreductase family protein [Solirubrobacterales bacterium]|nr:nitroreductase family protein [Solirubrobacterales bacterium]
MTEPDRLLPLSAEELLTTTRGVRKRLDFSRPVEREVLRECVATALQAPSGSNRWALQFVIVTDPEIRRAFGEVYRECYETYRSLDGVYIGSIDKGSEARNEQQRRTTVSADHLGENFGKAPAIVAACAPGRTEDGAAIRKTTQLGSVLPGMWSFMLAARLRGLGTSWTTVSLFDEAKTGEALRIPIEEVTIGAITPVAYTLGTDFKPALRPNPDEVIHWDGW